MRRLLAVLAAAQVSIAPLTALAADVAWEPGKNVAGVFDVDGPRSDGSMIVAGGAALYLMDPAGNIAPFARGPGGYHEDKGAEAYLANSTGGTVRAAGCSWVRDETFLLRLHIPIGVERVSAAGDETGSFANLTGVTALNGIAFDTTGDFDHRLLVSAPSKGKTVIFAIDCNGAVKVITRSAPRLEGGLAVAPSGFGAFGGALIAPYELSGKIYAIKANGTVSVVAKPSLATGPDIGVESVGFVPQGFMSRGGTLYYADRRTANNPHPGTDAVLKLPSAQLAAAGVKEGDLLVATEGGATLVAVRCAPMCTTIPVVAKPTTAHGEGHLAFALNQAPASPSPSPVARNSPGGGLSSSNSGGSAVPVGAMLGIGIAILLALVVAGAALLRRRRP
jgi:hypothetical protein